MFCPTDFCFSEWRVGYPARRHLGCRSGWGSVQPNYLHICAGHPVQLCRLFWDWPRVRQSAATGECWQTAISRDGAPCPGKKTTKKYVLLGVKILKVSQWMQEIASVWEDHGKFHCFQRGGHINILFHAHLTSGFILSNRLLRIFQKQQSSVMWEAQCPLSYKKVTWHWVLVAAESARYFCQYGLGWIQYGWAVFHLQCLAEMQILCSSCASLSALPWIQTCLPSRPKRMLEIGALPPPPSPSPLRISTNMLQSWAAPSGAGMVATFMRTVDKECEWWTRMGRLLWGL